METDCKAHRDRRGGDRGSLTSRSGLREVRLDQTSETTKGTKGHEGKSKAAEALPTALALLRARHLESLVHTGQEPNCDPPLYAPPDGAHLE
jgi:hypothetical protein